MLGGEGCGGGEREEKPSCGREGERGEGGSGEREEEKVNKMRKGEGGHEENEIFFESLHDGSVETVVLC